MSDVEWKHVNVALRELTPWERNPRRISKKNAERLLDLWRRIGQFQTIAIGPNGEVYDGHQRLSVLKAAFGENYVVQALQSSRPLTEKEREELTAVAHAGAVGQFDWDALKGWSVEELEGWGFDHATLIEWSIQADELRQFLSGEDAQSPDELWQNTAPFVQKEKKSFHSLIVHFDDRESIERFAKLVGQTVTEKTRFIWFPYRPPDNLRAYKVVSDAE